MRATTPAVSGHENDVPLAEPYALGELRSATLTFTPMAATSGLMRPSALGPTELKEARAPLKATAPTATTRWPSDGAPRVLCEGWAPSLPAELTTTIPRSAARSAALVLMAV